MDCLPLQWPEIYEQLYFLFSPGQRNGGKDLKDIYGVKLGERWSEREKRMKRNIFDPMS